MFPVIERISSVVTCTGPAQNLVDGEGVHGSHPLLRNCWLVIDYGTREVSVFTCAPTDEVTRLLETATNQWPHRNPWSKAQRLGGRKEVSREELRSVD